MRKGGTQAKTRNDKGTRNNNKIVGFRSLFLCSMFALCLSLYRLHCSLICNNSFRTFTQKMLERCTRIVFNIQAGSVSLCYAYRNKIANVYVHACVHVLLCVLYFFLCAKERTAIQRTTIRVAIYLTTAIFLH